MNWAPTVAIGLVLALVFGTIARRLGQSPLLGYLLAGVLIGPHTPGFVGSADLASQLADVGVILLMFGVGLGFSFGDLWSVRRLAVPGALAASGVVVLLGTGLGLALSWPLGGAAVLGMCLATASTVLIVRGMTDLGLLASPPGRIAVGWSLVEDLITVVLLVVLPAIAPPTATGALVAAAPLWQTLAWSLGKVVLLAAIVVYGGGFVVPRLLALVARAQSRELFTLAVLTFALGVAFVAAEVFGVSVALGAFFAGMVVGRSDLAHQAAADALPMRDAFAVLFFVAVGMLFDPNYVVGHPGTVLAALSFVLVGKPLVAIALMLRRGQSLKTALSVAAGLAQVSEFSFLLAGLATSLAILPTGGRDLVVAVALSSIAASPLLFRLVAPLERRLQDHPRFGRWLAASARSQDTGSLPADPLGAHVVICGFGRVGSVLGEFLSARSVPFAVIELDRTAAEGLRARGVNVLWGDAGSPTLLDRAGIASARAVVLTTPDAVTQRLAMEHIANVRADLPVLVRVHSERQRAELAARPNTRVVHAERELGFAMARHLLETLGASTIEAEVTVLAAERDPDALATTPRLFELDVRADAAVVGCTLAEIGLPATALVVAVVRGGVHLVARGPTTLAVDDVLLVFATGDDAQRVEAVIAGRRADDRHDGDPPAPTA